MTSNSPQQWTDDRLDGLAASTQSLLDTTQANTKAIECLIENQLAMKTLHDQVGEQTLQLKRAVDSLLSRDGGLS
jgi:hypothetical protein